MAEPQPRSVHEGADLDEDVTQAKSAEDRKAAAALASLDSSGDAPETAEVDAGAVSKLSAATAAPVEKKEVKKVKVDAADVALLVDELELTKAKATELLKAHDGDAVRALKAFIAV
ncbi:hypothetical protein HD806DRAFT_535941 [Xylariaceae sp. AK1471]|nr:hypothetical protein HD806DRAFT_535941 [Xylariaceae sp. AK1471]